jgi:hypothetical protein
VSLKVIKGKATVTLATAGAKVFLVSGTDRRALLTFPISVDIDTKKKWQLEATKTGFNELKQPVDFEDGQAEKTYNVELTPKGTPAAAAPVGAKEAATPTAPKEPKEPVAAKEPAAPKAPAAPKEPGFLNINSIPPSSCFLDGKSLGQTPQLHVQVNPGAHSVKFVNSELGVTKTIGVSVGSGETKAAVAKLQ